MTWQQIDDLFGHQMDATRATRATRVLRAEGRPMKVSP